MRKFEDGKDGRDADEERIVRRVLNNIGQVMPKDGKDGKSVIKEEVIKEIASKIKLPKDGKDAFVDYDRIEKAIRKMVPENDPLKIIDIIMKLPEEKKLKVGHISGLQQTINAFQSQLSRGYLHGGGINSASIYTETPTGLIDGLNTSYTTAHTIARVIVFSINGQYIHPNEYSASGMSITMITPIDASLSGKEFTIIYV
jgi:hypothetical protein